MSAFSTRQGIIDIEKPAHYTSANDGALPAADIVICTTGGKHLLDTLDLESIGNIRHEATDAEPMLLGYECHRVQRDALGTYDYYVFLEDDLVFRDPGFLSKCQWFARLVGNDAVLQPNRYEISLTGPVKKLYIDAELDSRRTAKFQDISVQPVLKGFVLGQEMLLRRTRNPHSGCYALNAEQMAHWAQQPYFLDRSTAFVTGLESAATLGLMRTFRVYKPAPENANFLEIEHSSPRHITGAIRADPDGGMSVIRKVATSEETSIKTRGPAGTDLYSATLGNALIKAMALESKLPEAVLQMPGMSGRLYRRLINTFIAELPDARYLEIGSWAGSTACAAMFGNRARICCIDNWSEFGGPKEEFLRATAMLRSDDIQLDVQESDFRKVDYTSIGKFNVYLFDGPHAYQDHYDGIRIAVPALDRQFVLIVDDWNWSQVRKGTLDAIRDENMTALYSIEIRTTQDDSHVKAAERQNSAWHNGYFMATIQMSADEAVAGRQHTV